MSPRITIAPALSGGAPPTRGVEVRVLPETAYMGRSFQVGVGEDYWRELGWQIGDSVCVDCDREADIMWIYRVGSDRKGFRLTAMHTDSAKAYHGRLRLNVNEAKKEPERTQRQLLFEIADVNAEPQARILDKELVLDFGQSGKGA